VVSILSVVVVVGRVGASTSLGVVTFSSSIISGGDAIVTVV
jgi:hypothetical protein